MPILLSTATAPWNISTNTLRRRCDKMGMRSHRRDEKTVRPCNIVDI